MLPQTKLVKGVDSMIKVHLFMFSLRYLRFAGHLCSCPPMGVAATIGLGCITPLHVASRLPFCLGLRFFLSCESAVDYFSSAVWEEWQLPLFTLPSEGVATVIIRYSLPSRGDDEQAFLG
uniref:Uncharacterized protein n=1 Tax=Fagus sylvatica TaxID=28930 RepID=A0A2N9HBI7_FAGSY